MRHDGRVAASGQHHDAEWVVLSVRELWEHERVQLGLFSWRVFHKPGKWSLLGLRACRHFW